MIPRTLLVILWAAQAVVSAGEPAVLFDGSSLERWETDKEGGWKIDPEGNLAPARRGGGYIWTREAFGDFELELEFKIPNGCNSGIFFRTNPKNPVQGGFEIQVFDSAGKQKPDRHDCGALYDAVAPRVNAARPAGNWNQFKLSCRGPLVVVVLNGQEVVRADLDEWTEAGKNPDGSKNKFRTALRDLPRSGRIGLQNHGHDVWFRKIRVRKL